MPVKPAAEKQPAAGAPAVRATSGNSAGIAPATAQPAAAAAVPPAALPGAAPAAAVAPAAALLVAPPPVAPAPREAAKPEAARQHPAGDAPAAPPAASVAGKSEKDIPLNLDPKPAPGVPAASPTRLAGWIGGMLLKLGLVLAIAYGSLSLLRRFMPGAAAAAPSKEMGVRRTIVLGAGRSVHLLDVEGHQILIGATPNQITLLADLSEPVLPVADEDTLAVRRVLAGDAFQAHLGSLVADAPEPAADTAPVATEAAPVPPSLDPDTYSDDELREEMRKRLFTMNRSAAGLANLGDLQRGGE